MNPIKHPSQIGPYKIVRHIATGGMGAVYEAVDENNRRVALKLISPSFAKDQLSIARFRREAAIVSTLKHPNIVSLRATGSEGKHHYIAFEFIDGTTLTNIISGRNVPVREALGYMKGIIDGMAAAHAANVIHRDIKPCNIMVTNAGLVKITDFGMAKALFDRNQANLTATGVVIGTPDYIAPELILGLFMPNKRTDIYSMGIVLYEMVTGRTPYADIQALERLVYIVNEPITPPRKINPALSVTLDRTIRKMCHMEPDARPKDIAEVEAMLSAEPEWPKSVAPPVPRASSGR
jgi:eukaryotic-like serine/threonine-protein kinase